MKIEQKDLLARVENLVQLEQRTTAEILKSLCLIEKGCRETRFLQIHHLKSYRHGGITELSNLEVLCFRHHQRK